MALTTTKPIIARYSTGNSNAYMPYTISMRYHDGSTYQWQQIYAGRTWIDADGNTEIRIDGILRDYIARWKHTYDTATQKEKPTASANVEDTIMPLENGSQFFYTPVIVSLLGMTQSFDVWGGWSAPWQEDIVVALDDAVCTMLSTLGDGIPPHIPPISTTELWLGLTLYNSIASPSYAIGMSTLNQFALQCGGIGTIHSAFTLGALYTALASSNIIDGGTPSTTASQVIDGGDATGESAITTGTLYMYIGGSREMPVAIIDSCAADFYVAWITPQGGWTCYGFKGNATIGGVPDVQSIIDRYDSDEVISIEQQHTYNLYTEPLTRDLYNHLATMKFAREVYVYDSKRNKGCYCSLDNRGINTMPSKTGKLQPFNVSLKEIMRKGI